MTSMPVWANDGNTTIANTEKIFSVSTVYEYPVQPGTEEWAAFTTKNQMLESCQLPEKLLTCMTTESLAETVLNYPLLPDMLAYNDYEEGYNSVKETFNGLRELSNRENAGSILYKYYSQVADITVDNYLEVACLEVLLNQDDFMNTMSQNEITALLEEVYNVESARHTDVLEKIVSKNNNLMPLATLTIYTPAGTPVTVEQRGEMSWAKRMANDLYIEENYPNVTELQGSTQMYNCHAYAFFSRNQNLDIWMNDPSAYMTDGSFSQLSSAAANRVIYYNNNNDYEGTTKGNHSGWVTSVSGYNVTVESKWGDYGLYVHDKNYSPYSSERTIYSYWW